MIISLSAKEAKAFYSVIGSEMRKVINEYDEDTCRVPSKKRIKDGQYGKNIIDKWEAAQPKISGTNFVNLDNTVACNLDLSDKEIAYSKHLLDKAVSELRKELAPYPKPYTGVLAAFDDEATAAENILAKI
jgi:hypothetical protein